MSNALMSDLEARAERRRTRTRADMLQDLIRQAWDCAQAAPDLASARKWLQRAHRLAPTDALVSFALANNLLAQGLLAEAETSFQTLADRYATAEAWAGLATCAHLLGAPDRARAALCNTLRTCVITPSIRALAEAVSAPAGWCALGTDGELQTGPTTPTRLELDGISVPLNPGRSGFRLPETWRAAATLEAHSTLGPMLGSPLPLSRFSALEGFVEAAAGGIQGWAWFPADPARDPVIRITGPKASRDLHATEPALNVPATPPLARPRRFALSQTELAALGEPVAFQGPNGRHLLGSPLAPGLLARIAPIWADSPGSHPIPSPARHPVAVIIPIHRGETETLACIQSVLATIPRGIRLIVVDDACPEPALVAALKKLERQRRLTLLRLPTNQGFPAAANAGLAAAAGHDAVLLNSDTLVPPSWLERLRTAAHSAPDIGTVTPLTNDGTIVSYPDPARANPVLDLAATLATDALAQQANGATTVDLPVGVGFCLYIRRDCLDQVGALREDVFAQGYGEENDFCLRARHHGWRNVAAPGVFIAHHGATSFGPARAHLVRRNTAILERLHPGYQALVARHIADDPLQPARRRIDTLRWANGRKRAGALIQITHAGGGGVDRVIAARAEAAEHGGRRPIVLRPDRVQSGPAIRVEQPNGPAYPNLVFPVPTELAALAKLLRPDRPGPIEQHHTLGHHHAVADLPRRLGVPSIAIVHDYARFCPRIALIGTERRYCGEPDTAACQACIADLGSLLEDEPPIPLLLDRSRRELSEAIAVIVPSADAAKRLSRHFAAIHPTIEPWEDDDALPPLVASPRQSACRVAVIGAIGVEKGFDVLLACARDARARSLPLEFIVIGFTADDQRLLSAGPVFITGEYRDEQAVTLIGQQQAQFALIPSIWPETWCFALSRAWQAGLPAAVFNLGAQAERVRATGRGWILPLGLPARALNDALLRLAPGALTSQYPYIDEPDSRRMDDRCRTIP